MTPADDARATWALLSEPERAVLAAVAPGTVTPQRAGQEAGMTWQRAARVARQLKVLGLVRVTALPKQVTYDLTGQGASCLTVGLYKLTLAHVWVGLNWRGYDPGLPVHARAEEVFCSVHASHDALPAGGPDRCGCGGVMCGCGAHYPRSFKSELPHGAGGGMET